MAWDGYPARKWAGHPAEFWIGMGVYVVTALATGRALTTLELEPHSRLVIGLLPLIPLLVMGRGLVRMIRYQDELYKRIQFEAIAYAAVIVIVLSLTLGLLEEFDVVPHVNSMWAGQVLVFAWGIAAGLLARRYR